MSELNPATYSYSRCIDRSLLKGGLHRIRCKLGLWSVEGRDLEAVERDAKHYWIQYFRDGEYNKLLASVPRSQTSGGMEGGRKV